ncbi:hypothetical protein Hamer_G029551, partial [Homarus americanus]
MLSSGEPNHEPELWAIQCIHDPRLEVRNIQSGDRVMEVERWSFSGQTRVNGRVPVGSTSIFYIKLFNTSCLKEKKDDRLWEVDDTCIADTCGRLVLRPPGMRESGREVRVYVAPPASEVSTQTVQVVCVGWCVRGRKVPKTRLKVTEDTSLGVISHVGLSQGIVTVPVVPVTFEGEEVGFVMYTAVIYGQPPLPGTVPRQLSSLNTLTTTVVCAGVTQE